MWRLVWLFVGLFGAHAFQSPLVARRSPRWTRLAVTEGDTATDELAEDRALLQRAADKRDVDAEDVYEAIRRLEKARGVEQDILGNLTGDWRLIFTTGEVKTQKAVGRRINYVPVKAVQSFDADTMAIENGVYVGDAAVLKFTGTFRWLEDKRRLEFDFFRLLFFGSDVTDGLPQSIRDKAGLKREGLEYKRQPFFTFFCCDGKILVGRGGGGGVALWANQRKEKDA